MSRKTPDTPPEQTSLVRALLIPILLFVGVIALAVLVGMFGDQISGNDNDDASGTRAEDGKTLSASKMQRFRQQWDEFGIALGPADAPVTVREFADYQCPACGAFEAAAERIREEWVDSGQVRFIFFDFPLPMHDHAQQAARAARCAGRQDAYWAFHQHLFENQQEWSTQADPNSTFLDYAVASGIQAEPLRRCLEQGATDQIVARNAQIAREVGIMSTPTVLIGPQVFSGVTDYETLSTAIENQLAAAESGSQ